MSRTIQSNFIIPKELHYRDISPLLKRKVIKAPNKHEELLVADDKLKINLDLSFAKKEY